MKSTGLIQPVVNLHQAGKIHNLHQVCGVFGCVWVTKRFKQVKKRKLSEICKQVVTRLLSSRYQDVFALFVPSCCDKSGTSGYHLVTRLINKSRLPIQHKDLSYEHATSLSLHINLKLFLPGSAHV